MLLCRDAVNFANRPRRLRLLIINCVTMWGGYGTYISELIYLVTMYYDTSALVGSDVKYLEPGPLSLPRMHFYCYRLAPSMGRLTTHSTLPMCAGGIPYFVFAVGQLGWQVPGGGVAAGTGCDGVVGCEGHCTGDGRFSGSGLGPCSLGPASRAQLRILEAVACQGRRLPHNHRCVEWPEVYPSGHYAPLGIYPPLRGSASVGNIRPCPRGSYTGGVVHTSPPPTRQVTRTRQHLPGDWPLGQHSTNNPTTRIISCVIII